VAWIVAILAWFYALFTGEANKGMRDLQAYCLRYQSQTYAYLLLLTQRYPSFSDE
jgi:predicted lactoylglutathione lyase